MGAIASQITSLTIVFSTVYSDADQRKHQSSASLAFVRGIHRGPVNILHKWPVTREMFPFDDVIMHNIFSVHILLTKWYKKQPPNAKFPLANTVHNRLECPEILLLWRFVKRICSPHIALNLICRRTTQRYKWLSKRWWGWWFETPSCPLWLHCNVNFPFSFCIAISVVWGFRHHTYGHIISEFAITMTS